MTDGAGSAVNRDAYDPYGRETSRSEGVANPWRFGGAYGGYTELVKLGAHHSFPALDLLGIMNPGKRLPAPASLQRSSGARRGHGRSLGAPRPAPGALRPRSARAAPPGAIR